MNSKLTVFFFLLLSRAIAQSDCQGCQAIDDSKKLTCMSDGRLYSSLLCARCQSRDNYELFSCSTAQLNGEACRTECIKQNDLYRCRAKCVASGNRNLIICGSNGQPYSNYCQAKCIDPTITPMFDCSVYNLPLTSCYAKCEKFVSCRKSSVSSYPQLVCGVDALVYPSLEELNCNNVRQIEDDQGNPKYNVEDCAGYVQLHYGKPVGFAKEIPPIYFPSKKTN